jgi:hypothetical protein
MLSIILLFQLAFQEMQSPRPVPKFESQVLDNNISIGYGIALGDVDGDAKPDILLADKKQFVWYRNGDWKRFVMIENLTERDNVCIAARDLDADGKVEVAVGAQWYPGETSDSTKSGSVHYLIRPKDPTQLWEAVQLPHEPTVHRMRWAKAADGTFYLVVVPLHGRGNKNGEGAGVKVNAYKFPKNPRINWSAITIDNAMHLTHNIEIVEETSSKGIDLYIAGKEGVRVVKGFDGQAGEKNANKVTGAEFAAGEVRIGGIGKQKFLATIEPMHGTSVAVYILGQKTRRNVLEEQLKEGHGLATGDLLGIGSDQVVAGWRAANMENKVGIKIYVPRNTSGSEWDWHWVDENGIAAEDLQVLDLNGDGKLDIVASGRATKNLKVYWNKTE